MAAGPAEAALRSVLITTDAVGGVWTYSVDLARGLARRGVRATLAVLGPAPSPEQVREAEAVARLVQTGLPLEWLADGPEAVRQAATAVAALCRETRPDLVHLNTPALAIGGDFGAPVLGGCHSCVGTWWAAVKAGPPPADLQWRIELHRAGLDRCDALVAPSQAFAAATAALYGRGPFIVRNGRDYAPPKRRAPAAGLFVFTAGRLWDEGKNLLALDRAAAGLDLPVLAAGAYRGPQGQRAPTANLTAPGTLSAQAVAEHLAKRPIFVSTALYEPFGLAVLEAAQAGCPLVLSDIPTFRELWSDAAVFVPARDVGALAAVLSRLGQDPDTRAQLGQAAKARAAAYPSAAMVDGVIDLYRQLVRRRGVTGAAA